MTKHGEVKLFFFFCLLRQTRGIHKNDVVAEITPHWFSRDSVKPLTGFTFAFLGNDKSDFSLYLQKQKKGKNKDSV